jgi:hypothetical protein
MTDLIRTALERLRAVFGRRTPGRHSRPATPPVVPSAPAPWLSPDIWGARLATARGVRQERQTPPVPSPQPQPRTEWYPPAAWEHTGALIRPYVACLEETPRSPRPVTPEDPRRDAP